MTRYDYNIITRQTSVITEPDVPAPPAINTPSLDERVAALESDITVLAEAVEVLI